MPIQRSTVLLVDDEEGIRQILARTPSDHFPTVQADNGASALQAAARLNGTLGLVVSDINMPIMDGLEFARAFRRMESCAPILFITGKDLAAVDDDGLGTELLAKPFGTDDFLATVTRLIMARSAISV